MTEKLQADYLDRCEGLQAQIQQVSQFDYCSVISTTYLGRTGSSRRDATTIQEQFSITDQSMTVGTLLDCPDCKIPLDSSATKSFMSKQYYFRNKSLQGSPNFSSKAKVI